MKVTNIDLYKYFNWPKPNKAAKGILHGIFFDKETDGDLEVNKKRLRPMMLIFPGGAYTSVSQREATPVCVSFLKYGFNCFYLEYSTAPKNRYPTMLIEAMMALTYLYKKAKDFYSDPNKITLCGFSAGGHLAGMLCSLQKEERELFYPLDKCGAHAKAAIFSYPALTEDTNGGTINNLLGEDFPNKAAFSIINRAREDFLPSFIWATKEDSCVNPYTNAEALKKKLDSYHVPNEFVLFPKGNHGLSTCDINTQASLNAYDELSDAVGTWVRKANDFLLEIGAGLTDKK